jgi:hypothetical protein
MGIFGPVLPHGPDSFGDPAGPYRVERAGQFYIVAQGWTPANQAATPLDHALLRINEKGVIAVISNDLWNPYDFAVSGNSFIVVDAARNSLERLSSTSGSRETVFVFKRLKATCGGKKLELTDREFEILHCLAERAGQVVTRDELLHLVWGYSDTPLTRTVDNFIFRLRHKLEPDPRHPTYIRKAYGDGYRLITD